MSTQHDAYGEELARIGRHQGEAVTTRLRLSRQQWSAMNCPETVASWSCEHDLQR
jgi:hypothetical protein